jgi:hypothetical protein
MRPITFSLQFRGVTTVVVPGVLMTRATAPGCSLITSLDEDGVRSRFEPAAGDEALLESRIVLGEGDIFRVTGTIVFGHRHSLRFESLDHGRLRASPDVHLSHGSAISEIEGGIGQFAGAHGRLASNFVLSDTGELTDNHLALLFIDSPTDRLARPVRSTGGWHVMTRQD